MSGHRQPASWPLFEISCADVNLSAERHRVFALLQRLAVDESICRRRAKKQGFSWKSREGIVEAVAGAALFSVARKANIALRLEEVVNEERRNTVTQTHTHTHMYSYIYVYIHTYVYRLSTSACPTRSAAKNRAPERATYKQ